MFPKNIVIYLKCEERYSTVSYLYHREMSKKEGKSIKIKI